MSHHLTLHIISPIPFSNLNRDDTGTPKRVNQGGALRALHSSQSIKRGIRKAYETASLDLSVRSGELSEAIAERAKQIDAELEEKKVAKEAKAIVGKLTKAESTDKESNRSIWLSQEEIETAAQTVVDILSPQEDAEKAEVQDFINGTKTGSLAISAFGRMFANSPQNNTEAALSVSPAVTTHAASIDTDYFSTVDDRYEEQNKTGATFLGVSQYTSGVFYRTVTIDKAQLRRSWAAFDNPDSRDNVKELVRSIVYGQPRGKENSTAPYTLPALVLAEEQRYRTAYDFESPVVAAENGGFLESTVNALGEQYQRARSFDASNFGPVEVLSGTYPELAGALPGVEPVGLDQLIDTVTEWVYDD